ncbi:helix-hairpin-helix domain-containing protein [Salinigranum sp.]|uniref:helix-hairpin-helix domain-containing protein n=1 Tax=Salinigranum sp. TaxID=1966351 RepID=UPI0035641950
MRVVLTDGTEFECANFKALDSGVLLTKDKKRKKVIGFVPIHQLRYVVPDDLEPVETPSSTGARAGAGGEDTPRGAPADATGVGTGPARPDDSLTVSPPAAPSEPVGGADAAAEGETNGDGSELRRLGGLGSTYAERLQAAGYGTLADLAAADPVTVAEAASVAPGRGRRWVDAARRAVAADDAAGDESESESDVGDGDGERDDAGETGAEDSESEGEGEADDESS